MSQVWLSIALTHIRFFTIFGICHQHIIHQTSCIIWSHLSPTGEHTCFAGTATVNRSPHRHSSRCWLEAPAGSSTEKLAAASGRRHWHICWCCLDRGPGSFDVEDATTLSWSSAAVKWVSRPPIRMDVFVSMFGQFKFVYCCNFCIFCFLTVYFPKWIMHI